MASLSTLLRAAAKPEPKPKAMVALARTKETTPVTPGLGSRPVRPTLSKGAQAPLTPATPGAQSSRLPAGRNREIATLEASMDDASVPLPPKRPPPIRQQVESHFGDQGLKGDRYLQDLIRDSEGGWVSMDDVLSLKRIKALRCSADDVLHALRDSWLETFQDEDGSAAIRRPPDRPMPKLEVAKQKAIGRPAAPSVAEGVVEADTLRNRRENQIGAGREAVGRPLFPGRLKGTVRSYDEETGSATLFCPQTEALFQRDIDVGWRELEESGVAINIGSLVSFRVDLGSDGQPRARDLELRAAEEDDEDPDEDNVPRPPTKRPKVAPAVVGQRYVGTIKSFHEGVGLGFIGCKATYNTYGRDVSVHRDELSGFEVGDEVSFELAAEPGVGTPKAITLEAPSAAQPPAPRKPQGGKNGDAKAPTPKAESKKAPPSKPKAESTAPAGNSKRWKGVIESFDEAKGIGRITCIVNGATRRCTVDEDELAGFIVGDSVSFKLLKDASGGAPKAKELEAEAE